MKRQYITPSMKWNQEGLIVESGFLLISDHDHADVKRENVWEDDYTSDNSRSTGSLWDDMW